MPGARLDLDHARVARAASPAGGDPDLRLSLAARLAELQRLYRTALEQAPEGQPAAPQSAVLSATPRIDPGPGLALLAEAFGQLPLDRPGIDARANPYGQLVCRLRAQLPPALETSVFSALRPLLVTTFAYGVPSDRALDRLAGYGGLLEIGAGGGYWARCLALRGATVHAFDHLAPAQQRRKAGHLLQHHPVFIGGPAEALAAVPHARTLLLGWPPGVNDRRQLVSGGPARFSSMGVVALERFRGPDLVFIGEHSASFGSPAFFARLERQFTLTETLPLPNLGRWRDAVFLYRRR